MGDTLQRVDGVQLGSYMDGMEILDKQFGPVVLTALRRTGMSRFRTRAPECSMLLFVLSVSYKALRGCTMLLLER